MARRRPVDSDEGLLWVLRHATRRTILQTLSKEESMSPSRLAELMDKELTTVAYHVRVCAEYEAVELVGTEPIRGSEEHFYRLAVKEPWALSVLGLGGNGPAHGDI